MLYLLFHLSQSFRLTVDNFNETVSTSEKPLVIEMWDPHCHHCRDFKPKWENYIENSRFKDIVVFCDINCVESTKICKKIYDGGYPQVIYFDTKNHRIFPIEETLANDNIDIFIEKQLSYPLVSINSIEESQKYMKITNVSTLFLLTTNNNIIYSMYREALEKFRKTSSIFLYHNSSYNQLIAIKSYFENETMSEGFTFESISSFISENILPSLPPLTDSLFESFKQSKQLCILVFINSTKQYQKTLKMIQQLDPSDQLFYVNINENVEFINNFDFDRKHLPTIIIMNSNQKKYYICNTELKNFPQFLERLNIRSIKWRVMRDQTLFYLVQNYNQYIYIIIALIAIIAWFLRNRKQFQMVKID